MASLIQRFWSGFSSVFTVRTTDEALERQVRQEFSFLFSDYGAQVVSNFYDSNHFGTGWVDVRIEGLYFRVVRDRGEIGVLVSPTYTYIGGPNAKWHSLAAALETLEMKEDDPVPNKPDFPSLSEIAKLLRPALPRLREAYSCENYAQTSLKMQRIVEAFWRNRSHGFGGHSKE